MSSHKCILNISYTRENPPTYFSDTKRAEYLAQRQFYNMTAEYNYFAYTLQGSKVAKNKDAESYFTRTGTGNSTGLFGWKGEFSQQEVEALKKRLKKTKSIIWHGFISFDAETSAKFRTLEQAQKFIQQTFGGLIQRAGFKKDNIELFCSLHVDKPHHHHIHFAFFEKEPKRLDKNGVIDYTKVGKISQKAIDNYMVSANMYLDDRSNNYHVARDEAFEQLKVLRGETLKGRENQGDLYRAIDELVAKLPKTGRLQYNSKAMQPYREDIDKVAKLLIYSDAEALAQHQKMIKELAAVKERTDEIIFEEKLMYQTSDDKKDKKSVETTNVDYFERLQADYNARLGNLVLGMCKQILLSKQNYKKYYQVNDKKAKIISRRGVDLKSKLILNVHKILAKDYHITADFQQTVQDIEKQGGAVSD